mmetsp:Transcript_29747/g.47403  ORF Transcript_29747/g.47403 Transcript_29747/m.47403 type:complete len:380 (-) Transcript_29747:146-1285(-)
MRAAKQSFYLLIALPLIHAQCGLDCSSCNNDIAACDLDTNCFYLVDNDICAIKNTCASDCRLCSTQSDCTATGAGGTGDLCVWNPSDSLCVGITCDTDCSNCSPVQQDPDNPGQTFCEASRAPPNGCQPESSEDCIPNTPAPTTWSPTPEPDTLQPTTSAMPTASPTTAEPTSTATPTTQAPTTEATTTEATTTETSTTEASTTEDDSDSTDDTDDEDEVDTETEDESVDAELGPDDDEVSVDTDTDSEDDGDDEGEEEEDSGDTEDDDECEGLTQLECTEERDDDGDNACGYNVETNECFSVVRRAGLNGVGSFDDGFVTAHTVAKAEADKLFTVVGVLSAIGGTLLIVAVVGGYYMYKESAARRKAKYSVGMMDGTF